MNSLLISILIFCFWILISLLYSINKCVGLIADRLKQTSDILDNIGLELAIKDVSRIQRDVERISDIVIMTDSQKIKRNLKIDNPKGYKNIIGE